MQNPTAEIVPATTVKHLDEMVRCLERETEKLRHENRALAKACSEARTALVSGSDSARHKALRSIETATKPGACHPRCRRAGEGVCKVRELLDLIGSVADNTHAADVKSDESDPGHINVWAIFPERVGAETFLGIVRGLTLKYGLNYLNPTLTHATDGSWQVSVVLADIVAELA